MPKFDTTAFTINYEMGELSEDRVREGFQHMVDDGIVWQDVDAEYGREAAAMIAAGLIEGRRW